MSHLLTMPLPGRADSSARTQQSAPVVRDYKPIKKTPYVSAVESIEPLKGRTRPYLMRGDDGHLYVVKSYRNPYGPRILANEYLATRLAHELGLSVPDFAFIRVPEGLGQAVGLHFGSRLQRNRSNSCVHDWLPAPVWSLVQNPNDLIGAYVFDSWTGNADQRQVIFARKPGVSPFRLFLIDHGHCFGGASWRLQSAAVQCPILLKFAYHSVTSWADLDPWLTSIEQLAPARIEALAAGMPAEWLGDRGDEPFRELIESLVERRLQVRAQIATQLGRGGHPFTCWRYRSSLFVVPSPHTFGKIA